MSVYRPISPLVPKFQVSSHLLWLYSVVCVRPGRKPSDVAHVISVILFQNEGKETSTDISLTSQEV